VKAPKAKLLVASIAAVVLAAQGAVSAQNTGVLDQIRAKQTIRIAYRPDAPPFSYKNNLGEPAGYMVDVCKSVAEGIRAQLNLASLNVAYVPVSATDRFNAIQDGRADLLCGPTSVTLTRRESVDFSIPTFVDGAGLLVRGDAPKDIQSFAGKSIGVTAGTTTEEALRNTLKGGNIAATVVTTKDYDEGLALLDAGKIAGLFGDHVILEAEAAKSKDPSKLALAENYLTVEPYALALKRGDEAFRLAVDRSLSRIYRSGQIMAIYGNTFGTKTKPAGIIQALYLIVAYPE
jgi:ABC-type amino acid transport substrate-binding protein